MYLKTVKLKIVNIYYYEILRRDIYDLMYKKLKQRDSTSFMIFIN